MSDTKSLDLETAQRLYIAAGHPEQAEAAGFVLDAVRNTVQGEWGVSFVASLEGLLKKYIEPLIAGQKETQDAIGALGGRFRTLEDRVEELALRETRAEERLDHKREEIDQIKRELAEIKAWRDAQERGS